MNKNLLHSDVIRSKYDGFVLFIDISGFTRLTEQHMNNSFKGAEEVSDLLNAVFNPIIDSIYSHNGTIAVYAGDALTAVFQTDDYREPFKAISKIYYQISHGAVEGIRIKSILTRGKVNVNEFKYGAETIRLYDGYPLWTINKAQIYAKPDCLIVDRNVYKMMDKTAKQSVSKIGTFYLLSSFENNVSKLKSFASRKKNRPKKSFAEFRNVTSIFINFTALKRADERRRFISYLADLCLKYKGNLNMLDSGDKGYIAFIIFGAPVSYEDDRKRAINLLLELRKKYSRIRAGVTYGMAFAGVIGNSRSKTYTAIGDNVNSAARLMSRADEGGILTSEEIFRELYEQYEFEYTGIINIKGKNKKITAYALRGQLAQREKTYDNRFVGREEYMRMAEKIGKDLIHEKFCPSLIITGEAGMGKSRLINEMCSRMGQAIDKYTIYADDINKAGFHPFIRFLKQYFNINDSLSNNRNTDNYRKKFEKIVSSDIKGLRESEKNMLREGSYLIEGFLGLVFSRKWRELDAKSKYDKTESEIILLFRAIAGIRPTVFIFEDYHWIDEESKKLLMRLMHNMKNANSLFIVSSRPDEQARKIKSAVDDNLVEIDIDHFDDKEMREFLKDRFLYIPDENLFKYIMEKSAGNPFYAEQISLYLSENEFIGTRNNKSILMKDVASIPITIYSLIISRIDRLALSLKNAIKNAAVIGNEFELRVLSEIMKNADIMNSIDEGRSKGIWDSLSEIKYIFKHSIIKDTVYEMQVKKEIRNIHHRTAEVLSRFYSQDASKSYEIGFHYDRAESFDKAKEFLYKGFTYSKEMYRNADAVKIIKRLIELSSDNREMLDNVYKLIDLLELTGEWNEAAKILEPLSKSKDFKSYTPLDQAEIAARICFMKVRLGDSDAGLKGFAEIEEFYSTCNYLSKLLSIYNFEMMALSRKSDFQGALAKFNMIVEKSEGRREDKEIIKTLCMSYINAGFANQQLENLDEALGYFEKALILAKEIHDKRLITKAEVSLGNIYLYKSDFQKAEEIYLRQLKMIVELGDKYMERVILSNLGALASYRYDFKSAIEFTNRSKEISQYTNEKRGVRMATGNLGSIYAILGEYEKALEYLNISLSISRGQKDKKGIAVVLDSISKIYLHMNDMEKVKETVTEAYRISSELKLKSTLYSVCASLAQLHLDENNIEKAREVINSAYAVMNPETDLDVYARIFIVRERILSKTDIKSAIANLKEYLNTAKEPGALGMLHAELYFLTEEAEHMKKGLGFLKKAYAKTFDTQFQQYHNALKDNIRTYKI